MDIAQLHIVNKLAIFAIIWLFTINWSVTVGIIAAILELLIPKRYYLMTLVTISAVTTIAAYIAIACAVIRFIYLMFWS